MIDALFGSKTRVKLLHLFFNNTDKSFYVREITRIIEEQINSVRRELANMLNLGLILSEESDNKLYYRIEKKYKYFNQLRSIFDDKISFNATHHDRLENNTDQVKNTVNNCESLLKQLTGIKLAILSGSFVDSPKSEIDILIVGNPNKNKLVNIISQIEKIENRILNYSYMHYDEFYYRLSIRDKFITDILDGDRQIIIDKERLFT